MGCGLIAPSGVGPSFAAQTMLPGPYKVEHYAYDATLVVTNKTPYGAYRGFGITTACYALERLLDMAAHRLGLDPLEIRRRNLLREAEDLPYWTATAMYVDSGSFQACLDKAEQLLDYAGWRDRQAAARAEGRHIGIGWGAYMEGAGVSQMGVTGRFGGEEYCGVEVAGDGSVRVRSGLASQGQNHRTMISLVVADELGVAPDQVTVLLGDTGEVPRGLGCWSCRSALVGGAAAIVACRDLVAAAQRWVADETDIPPELITFADGRFHGRAAGGRTSSFSLSEVAARQPAGLLRAEADYDPHQEVAVDSQGRPSRYPAFSNGVHAAVCEVDATTGQVRLLDYVAVHDCGRIIHPAATDGQVVGSVAQAIGGTFLEELCYDESGQLLTGSYMDYLLPTAGDVPDIRLAHLETPSRLPGGFKGVAEGGTIIGPACLANAVSDALRPFGVDVNQLPASPNAIRLALAAASPCPAGGKAQEAGQRVRNLHG